MKINALVFLVFLTLISAAFLVVFQTLPPPSLPASAPSAQFSAERAIDHIRVIASEPRLTGTPAYEDARNYVLAVLKDLGLETETQRSGTLRNTIGWIEGNSSSEIVLLTAHLDTVAQSPGASDDGSGVAVLLETARALMAAGPLRNTVMFLFTDFEEGGMYGAKAFITRHPWAKDVKIVIGFDAGGSSGPAVLSATSSRNGWLIRQLATADPYFVGSSAINALAESNTDFGHGFKVAGFPGYEFDLYWNSRILHTPEDNIENLNPSSIQHQGYHALSLARHYGTLNGLADPRDPDTVYFSVLRSFTVVYSSIWAIPLAIGVTGIGYTVIGFGLRRRILSWNGIGYGVFVLLVGLIIAPLPNILLGRWAPGGSPQSVGVSLDQPLYVSMVVLSTVTLTVLWYSQSRRIRNTSIPDLTTGALMPMVAGMVGTAVAFPALSFAFTWPILLNLLVCAYWFYREAQSKPSKTVIVPLLLSGAANTLILGPTILLGLFDQTSLTLLLLGTLCGFLVPQIHLMLGWTTQKSGVKITIRHASSADNILLAEIGAETFSDAFAQYNTPEDMRLYLESSFSPEIQARELADSLSIFLIAEVNGGAVGYAHLREGVTPVRVIGSRPVEIVRFYARSQWVGRRVGAALMKASLNEASIRGCDVIWLGVWEKNQRAIAFYRKWGFQRVGTQEFQLGKDIQHDLLMVRTVSPAGPV